MVPHEAFASVVGVPDQGPFDSADSDRRAEASIGQDDRAFIAGLRAGDPEQVAALRSLLGPAALREATRRAHAMGLRDPAEIGRIADDARDDAVIAVLGSLDRFEGRSRFSTWAWKFAVHTAGVAMRKRIWQDREVPTEDAALESLAGTADSVAADAERRELMAALAQAIRDLTPRRREVLLALAVSGVPIDVLAARLDTTRGALYKTLHDARRALRASLAEAGFDSPLEGAGG